MYHFLSEGQSPDLQAATVQFGSNTAQRLNLTPSALLIFQKSRFLATKVAVLEWLRRQNVFHAGFGAYFVRPKNKARYTYKRQLRKAIHQLLVQPPFFLTSATLVFHLTFDVCLCRHPSRLHSFVRPFLYSRGVYASGRQHHPFSPRCHLAG